MDFNFDSQTDFSFDSKMDFKTYYNSDFKMNSKKIHKNRINFHTKNYSIPPIFFNFFYVPTRKVYILLQHILYVKVKIIMFWNKEYTIKEVGEQIIQTPIEQEWIEYILKNKFSTTLQESNNSQQWAAFGIVLSKLNKLNIIYTKSLATMLSGFATGIPQPYETDMYLKEESIENLIINKYNDLSEENLLEEDKFILLMQKIITLYVDGSIKRFEKATMRVTAFLTYSENELFEQIPGLNNHEKMRKLLNSYKEYNIIKE